MSDMDKEKKQQLLQQLGYEFEGLRQQLAGIDAELQELNLRISEFERAKETLSALSNSKKDEEMLVPLSEGLFIKANIKNVKEVLVGVGSGVVVGKDMMKAKDYVQERIDEADNLINRLNSNAQYFVARMRELEPELQRLTLELRR
ncbi:MAG: prefoldin subunit alpha [Nanoarchaeota archaeon]|nr:prefoldin subunit alpha [Nanoarchaeota archaeon]